MERLEKRGCMSGNRPRGRGETETFRWDDMAFSYGTEMKRAFVRFTIPPPVELEREVDLQVEESGIA
jgi:hypothetical protein